MSDTIETGRQIFRPPSVVTDVFSEVYVLDGINEARRWDGVEDSATTQMGVEAPTAAPTATMGGGGAATAGDYTLYYRYLRSDGKPSNLSPVLTKTATANQQFSWATVADHADGFQKQLFRSLSGDSATVYLVTTLANGVTTYVDQLSDATLAASTALPILNPNGKTNANRFGVPPLKFCAAWHLDRMWFAGDAVYNEGSVAVTNGSATVTGRGTFWTTEMGTQGWSFWIEGEDEEYTISSVNESTQVITLSANYNGSTHLFNQYAVRNPMTMRNLVYYSRALEAESVPADSYVALPEDGDEITGLMVLRQNLYVLKQRHIYKLGVGMMQGRDSPVVTPNMSVTLAAERGCVNHRAFAVVEGMAYLLDDRGVYAFDGGGVQDVSEPIRDYWRPYVSPAAINFRPAKWFFTSTDPQAGRIRFHVSLGESYLPEHSLVFDYKKERWDGEEKYPWGLGGSCLANIHPGKLTSILGGEFGKHYLFSGTLDGTTARTIRGTATAATALSITDSSSDAVIPSNPVGSVLSIVGGKGKGQQRRIVSYSSNKMTVDRAFFPWPDTTSVYQVGGIEWSFKTTRFRFPVSQTKTERRILITAEPTTEEATLDVRRYIDRSPTPEKYKASAAGFEGVTITADSADAVLNLKRARTQGADTWDWSGWDEVWRSDAALPQRRGGGRRLQLELRGFSGMDPVEIREVEVVGAG